MTNDKLTAKMPRLLGAMFATAAVAACAFAGTAFAADGYKAEGVEKFYDDSYALMRTAVETTDSEGNVSSDTKYVLIDKNYNELYTTEYSNEVTDYGILVRDEEGENPTYKEGLNTYTGKTLLDMKYDAISYSEDTQMVFAAYAENGKVVLEQYARGTSTPIATLDIALGAKDAKPWVNQLAATDTFVIVRAGYDDEQAQEGVVVEKLVAYTEKGMELKDMTAPEGFDFYGSTDAISDGIDPVFYQAQFSKTNESSWEYENAYYLADGTMLDELTGYEYEGNNFDSTTGNAADKFLFVKTDRTKDADDKVTNVKSTAKVVGKDGKTIATLPEQSVDANASFDWGVFGNYVYVTGNYSTEYTEEGQSYSSSYSTYLPCKIFDASGNVAKEIANAESAYTGIARIDKTPYMTVTSYANFDDSVKKSYDSENDKYRYSGRFTTYLDENLNEFPGHTVTNQSASYSSTDEPQAYMLDGTKLYTGAKFAYDKDGNFVQRAGQYVTSIYNDLHNSTGDYNAPGYGYGYGRVRVGSTDTYIATSDNGKFGIVSGDGTEIVASEYNGLYSQYNSELAMVKKDGKWFFVDLSGRARAEMYRLYNQYTGEHFYTASASERDDVVAAGWTDEGTGWIAPGGSSSPVFRLYNSFAGEHHYTMSATERDSLIEAGWTDEGVGWFSDAASTVPLFREYNPNEPACNHNYTTDAEEHANLISIGWQNEGIAWYGVKTVDKIDDANAKAAATPAATQSNDLAAAAL